MSEIETAQQVYDRLWHSAQAAFAAGQVTLDPWLDRQAEDTRRGLTLIARPDAATRDRIAAFIDELNAQTPGQYVYRAEQLHITILSLISASAAFDLARAPVERYNALLVDLFSEIAPFRVRMEQVTAALDSVLVCGDADGDALNALRERVRMRLSTAGLGDGLDHRYRSVTAHMTVLRFRRPPDNLPALAAALTAARTRSFGTFAVEQIAMVTNDWYMSPDQVSTLARYRLGG